MTKERKTKKKTRPRDLDLFSNFYNKKNHLEPNGSFRNPPETPDPSSLLTPTLFATHAGIGGALSPTARRRAE